MGCYKLHNYTTLRIAHTSNTARSREGKSDAGLYKYKFGQKELQDELGLDLYDFGARMYDMKAPHFLQMDPKAEQMRRWSPYCYAYDNPMRFTDPDGMKPVDWYQNKVTGNVQWFNGSGAVAGYNNIGNSTNLVAGTGQGLQLNSNGTATDMNSGKVFGANRTIVVNSSTGTTVKTAKEVSESSDHGGFAFADGGNNQDPSSLDRGGRDVQWVDMNGMLEVLTTLLGLEFGGSTPNGKGTNGGKPTADDKVGDAIDAVDSGASAVKEANGETAKDSVRTTYYDSNGKETKSEIRVKRDDE